MRWYHLNEKTWLFPKKLVWPNILISVLMSCIVVQVLIKIIYFHIKNFYSLCNEYWIFFLVEHFQRNGAARQNKYLGPFSKRGTLLHCEQHYIETLYVFFRWLIVIHSGFSSIGKRRGHASGSLTILATVLYMVMLRL